MGQKYPTATSILGKLISMIVAEHGNVKSAHETGKLFMRIRRAGISPEMSDAEIEAELFRLMDTGDFGPEEEPPPEAPVAVPDGPWHETVRSELERTGATFEQEWELSQEVISRRALTFEPTDDEGIMMVVDRKRRRELFRVRLEDILPALEKLPDGAGAHNVIAELRKVSVD